MAHLSPTQLQTLAARINASTDPAVVAARNAGADNELARLYNLEASPAFVVWRTSVSRVEIYNNTSPEGTTWSWTFYKNQSAVEQNAWVQMFMGDQADFSKANLRAGISVIFTAASSANATHALAIGKRNARLVERVFASGTGSTASPGTLVFEGTIDADHIAAALRPN